MRTCRPNLQVRPLIGSADLHPLRFLTAENRHRDIVTEKIKKEDQKVKITNPGCF